MRYLLFSLLLCTALLCGGCFFQQEYPVPPGDAQLLPEPEPDGILQTGDGDVEIWLEKTEQPWGLQESRVYVLPNGDEFHQIRCSFDAAAEAGEIILDTLTFPKKTSMHRYSAENGEWFVSELGAGEISGGQYHSSSSACSALLLTPLTYLPRENHMLEYLPAQDGFFRSSRSREGWQLELCAAVTPGAQVECFYLLSGEQLVDWEDPVQQTLWAGYDFTAASRWCYAGYYYLAPENYIPSGENYYHRLPAAYIAAQCGEKEGRICYDLSLPMLHVMLELQNDQGYFPTQAGSQWLLEDYEIGAGFYDTRFNSDLVEALLVMNEKHQIPEFADAAMRYGQYFQSMAEQNHYALPMENGEEAWLIWDYDYRNGCLANHCSLNHQIAEILVLYRLFDLTGYEGYETLAQRMLNGILAVGEDWILPDQDLAYAYLSDGSMGMQDYPYLTYNDLFDLRAALDARYGSYEPMLDRLMSAKMSWMEQKGVTGYKE